MMIETDMTERIQAALDAGDIDSLHALLETWPAGALKGLIEDLKESYRRTIRRINQRYQEQLALLPKEGNSSDSEELPSTARVALDRAYHGQHLALAEVYCDIAGVACCCLERKAVKQ